MDMSGTKKGRVRPKKLSVLDEQFFKVTSLRGRKKSSNDLAQHLADSSFIIQFDEA